MAMRTMSSTPRPLTARSTPWVLATPSGSTRMSKFIARQQVNGYSNGKWKKSATYTEAINICDLMGAQYHQHEDDSPTSSVAESPPPSPTLPSSPVVSPVRAFRHSSLPPTPVAKTPSRTSAVARVVASSSKSGCIAVPPIVAVAAHRLPATYRSPSPSPLKSARITAVTGPSTSTGPVTKVMGSVRNPGAWRVGDSLWGVEGELLLLEDRYIY
ncbi:hypothetical protein B0H14DRAFT_3502544 [Mycena olivaceomarginata]|nr:hypothetical protein B0H14DRAFT_3502544 [Mycena olivaceomarginata]